MQSFKDSNGNTWSLEINYGVNKRVLIPMGIDLLEPDKCAEKLDALMISNRQLSDIVYRLIASQVRESDFVRRKLDEFNANLSDSEEAYTLEEAFWCSVDAADLTLATEALANEITFFIQTSVQEASAAVFTKMKRINDSLRRKSLERYETMLESDEMETLMDQEVDRVSENAMKELKRALKH